MKKNTNENRYKVPQDVFMDILRILFRNKIKYKIESIKEKENILIMQISFSDSANNYEAQENIESILNDYSKHMEGILSDILIEEENE